MAFVSSKLVIAALCLVAVSLCSAATLQSYNVDSTSVTVGGLSSGAFAAVQFGMAFSCHIAGVGVVAGGPFYCAQNNVYNAVNACMKYPSLISVTELVTITHATEATGFIDNLKCVDSHKVFIFSGNQDTIVVPGVVQKLETYYSHFISNSDNILSEYSIPSEHAWVTPAYGSACSRLGSPFINNCDYDLAGNMLGHLYPGLLSNTTADHSNLLAFSQSEFISFGYTSDTAAIGDIGYIFVPPACKSKSTVCKLHVALHGCEQTLADIGTDFVLYTGLNEYATANNIIILYPQFKITELNPKGCLDWWGYTGPDYASNIGAQNIFLKNMIDRVLGTSIF